MRAVPTFLCCLRRLGVLFIALVPLRIGGFPAFPPASESMRHYESGADIPLVAADPNPYVMSPFDRAILGVFRWTLQRQTGVVFADEPGFEGLTKELREYQRTHTLVEQAAASENTMKALAGPIPAIFGAVVPSKHSPVILAWFTHVLLGFLVGRTTMTQRAPGNSRPGGVLVERCSVLESSNCKGVCMRMCKIPTEKFFSENWGTPLHMSPNFETYQCQLSFGNVPPDPATDPTLPQGCLKQCPRAPIEEC